MDAAEHKQLVECTERGEILIGVDRIVARRFFTDISITAMKEATGVTPYFRKSVVLLAFVIGPLASIGSVIWIFILLGWWGLIAALFCPLAYFITFASSSHGRAGLKSLTGVLIFSAIVHFSHVPVPLQLTGPVLLFIFSLWSARFLYVSSAIFYRSLAMQNAKAFTSLRGAISIRNSTPTSHGNLKALLYMYLEVGIFYFIVMELSYLWAAGVILWTSGIAEGLIPAALATAVTIPGAALQAICWLPSLLVWLFSNNPYSFGMWAIPGFYISSTPSTLN